MGAQHSLSRTELLIGEEGLNKLKKSKVVVFGVGGVGSYTIEALARAGVGELIIVDDDTVCLTNLNRQVHATYKTISLPKVEVMKERIESINRACKVITHQVFVTQENIAEIIPDDADYVVDAIDTVTAKLGLAEYCYKKNIKIMSSMGTGNKLDPTQLRITDISKTSVCPLAKTVRKRLRQMGIEKGITVVYSLEKPQCVHKSSTPGSMVFVPGSAGLLMASYIVRKLVGVKEVTG